MSDSGNLTDICQDDFRIGANEDTPISDWIPRTGAGDITWEPEDCRVNDEKACIL